MSIKNKLIGVMAISIVSVLVNIYIVSYMLKQSEQLQNTKLSIFELNSDLQQLKQDTKNFLEYKDAKYEQNFQENYKNIINSTKEFKTELQDLGLDTTIVEQLGHNFLLFKNNFERVVDIQKTLGYNNKQGLKKALNSAVKKAEINAKRLQNQDIFSMVLTLRNLEKSFMLTHNKKYVKKFKRSYNALIYFIDGNFKGETDIKKNLENYKKSFIAFAKATEKKGLDSSKGVLGEMNSISDKNEKLFKKMLDTYSPLLEDRISSLETVSLMVQLAFGALMVFIIILLINSIVSPIKRLIATAKDLTGGDGDLTIRLDTSSKDEIAEANHYINGFIEKVQTVLTGVIGTSSENSTLADRLAKVAHEVEERSETENNELKDVVSDTSIIREDLTRAIAEAEVGKENIIRSNSNLEATQKDILVLVDKVQDSSELQLELAGSLSQLSDDAAQVKDVLTVISDIAEQTNLLALNAAIEAARAGEHGRGFAVVADEVRKLAERTQKSLTEINATVNVIVQAIVDSSQQMNQNSKEIEELAVISTQVGDKINETVNIMSQSSKMSENILDGYRDNAQKTDRIIDKIQHVSTISNDNIASIDIVAKVSRNLNEMTEQLQLRLQEFKV